MEYWSVDRDIEIEHELAGFIAQFGMLELWNNGIRDNAVVALENQNEHFGIDFILIVAYFLVRKQKMGV